MHRDPDLPGVDELEHRRIYHLQSRNLRLGVFDGRGGFIGIRRKFDRRFLFCELHWDVSEHHGTVTSARATEHVVADSVEIVEGFSVCGVCGEPDAFDRDRGQSADERWFHLKAFPIARQSSRVGPHPRVR